MDFEGTITKVFPRVDGISKRTGEAFVKQDFVIEGEADSHGYRPRMAFKVFGEQRLAAMDIREGDSGTLRFDIDAREYNGRWYNDITAFMFVKDNAGEAGPGGSPAPQYAPAPQYGAGAGQPAAGGDMFGGF